MKLAKFQRLFKGQTFAAQKVYTAVPIQEAWDTMQIIRELYRMGTNQNHSIVQGCLNTLVDAGLIKEVSPKVFRRVPVSEELPDEEEDEQLTEPTMAGKLKPEPLTDPFEILANLSKRAIALAEAVHAFEKDIEQAALLVQAKLDKDSEELNQLRQLKALLANLR